MMTKPLKTNLSTLHTMIRTFVGYGAPVVDDGVGPNKADWPFFTRMAHKSELEARDMHEAAERFYKYRNTQLPSIMRDMHMSNEKETIEKFIITMKEEGEVAKREYEAMSEKRMKKQARESSARVRLNSQLGSRHDPFADDIVEAVMHGYECDDTKAREIIEEKVKAWVPPAHLTVSVREYTDSWTNKWGKEFNSIRLALDYNYNPTFNEALKEKISFPDLKFNSQIKAWSISNDKEVLQSAVAAIENVGGWFNSSLDTYLAQDFPEKKQKQQVKKISATLKGNAVVLSWPYLSDPDERMAILSEVKSTQGRKYNPDNKTWSISITEAAPLIDRLRKSDVTVALDLASSIESIPEVHTVMHERAKRIAISGASSLSDEMIVAQMSDTLSQHFPEGHELYPFQYVGVRFAELANGRCLIGDDMGIGKTIQALAHIALNQDKLPALVVCPASVKYNWLRECNTWLPDIPAVVLEGRKGDIPMYDPTTPAKIVICNYDIVNGRKDILIDYGFNIIVFDESHYLKNAKTQRTIASLEVAETSEQVICLSGTAITNRPNEFFTTLNLLRPHEFNSSFEYGKRYCDGHQQYIGRGREVWNFDGASNTDELHARTRDFCIRRLKKEVLTELPDKVRSIHNVMPSKSHVSSYKKVQQSWLNEWSAHVDQGTLPQGFVLNMLTDLRHECGRIKVDAAVDWIKNYTEITGKPVVVFAHHRDVLVAAAKALTNDKDNQLRIGGITGSMKSEQRNTTVERFQNNELDVLFCSTVAAKEGITLTAADTVLFIEREWTPAWEEQAEDRVNRIGQESNSVQAVYLTVTGTIDEKFNAVVEEKRKVIQAVLDGGGMDEREGIAKMLIQSMIASGDLPDNFGTKRKGKSNDI